MPWSSQYEFIEGETINVRSYLDTHHGGHMEIRACKIIDKNSCTKPEHFEGNELEFVHDNIYDGMEHHRMPKDDQYPHRGMYAGWHEDITQRFSFEFKLPMGIFGDKVLLQWKYIAANSVRPPIRSFTSFFENSPFPFPFPH